MKNLIIIVALGFGLLACTSSTEKTNNANIDLVKSYIKAVEDLDFEAMNLYLDENYLGMGPSYGDSIGKYEAVANWEWNVNESLREDTLYPFTVCTGTYTRWTK